MMTSLLSHEPNREDGLILRGVSSSKSMQYAFLREFFHNVIWSKVKLVRQSLEQSLNK